MHKIGHPDRSQSQVKLFIISSIWWAASAKIASAFLRHSCAVEAICPPDHPFHQMKGFQKIYPYKRWGSLQSLYRAIKESNPYLLIPCDDGVVWQLHALYRSKPELRLLIERSLGSASSYDTISRRADMMHLAKEVGVRVPKTKVVAHASDLEGCFTAREPSWVLKRDGTHAGKGVRVVHSVKDATVAMVSMSRRSTFFNALGRVIVIHDAVALWSRRNVDGSTLSLQQFIAGRPANLLMVCRQGEVLGMVSVEVLLTEGTAGAALVARLIDNKEMRTAAQRIAKHLQLSGFHGLDFVLEKATGDAYFIELNPRCTQLGHLPVSAEGDLAGIYARSYNAGASAIPRNSTTDRTIAFFPQAILSNTNFWEMGDVYVDVPWSQPKLVAELVRRDWRDRSLIARILCAIRPPNRIAVGYDMPIGENALAEQVIQLARNDHSEAAG